MRRTRSKFGARLEPFSHIDVQLYPGRNLDIITQVVAIDAFATDIVSDYGRYTCACAMLETAERLAGEERAPATALHRLTVGRCGRWPTGSGHASYCWTPTCCVPWGSPDGRRR